MSDLVLNGAESVKQAKLVESLRKNTHYFVELAILGKGATKLFWPFFHKSIVPRIGISKMVVKA